MRVFAFLLLFCSMVFAVNLSDISVYDRHERVDIMLSFDKPYKALLHQSKEDGKMVFTLDGLSLKTPFSKDLDSKLVKQISIVSSGDTTKIVVDALKKLDVEAVKGEDLLSLRIRLLDPAFVEKSFKAFTKEANEPVKVEPEFNYQNYVLILLVLFALIILLWVLKYYFRTKITDRDFEIHFSRQLDRQNKFMVIEYKHQRYTMIIGSSNLLLESTNTRLERATRKDNTVYADYTDSFAAKFDENKEALERFARDLK